ncbi:MAG: hypothetical protein AAGU32_08940, partial [Bacillota bacterium]
MQNEAMDYLLDLYTNPDKYIEQLGAEGYKAALDEAFIAAEAEYEAMEPILLQYGDTAEEGMVVLCSLAAEFPQYFGDTLESCDVNVVAGQITLPSWYELPDEWDTESLYEAMSLSAYMDYAESWENGPLPEDGPLATGHQIYLEQNPDYIEAREAVVESAEGIPIAYASPEERKLRGQLRRQGESWEDLPLEQRAYYAQLKIKNYQSVMAERYAEYDRLYSLDIAEAESQKEALEAQYQDAKDQTANAYLRMAETDTSTAEWGAANAEYERCLEEESRLETEIATLESDIYNAQRIQEGEEWRGRTKNIDFPEFSAKGAAVQNPSAIDAALGSEVQNPVMFAKYICSEEAMEELDGPAMTENGYSYSTMFPLIDGLREIYRGYTYMTDEEVGVYNYLLAKEGKESAGQYLAFLEETLNYRQGNADAETMAGQPVAQVLYGIPAGLEQWGSGIRQLFSSDRLPTSSVQFTSNAIYEDLADDGFKMPDWLGGKSLGQMAYNTSKRVGYTAPSLLLTAVTAGAGGPIAAVGEAAGALAMGASIKGNAYNWALGHGYDKAEAEAYSILIGAGTVALQYGLKWLGSYAGKQMQPAINKAVTDINGSLPEQTGGIVPQAFGTQPGQLALPGNVPAANNMAGLLSAGTALQIAKPGSDVDKYIARGMDEPDAATAAALELYNNSLALSDENPPLEPPNSTMQLPPAAAAAKAPPQVVKAIGDTAQELQDLSDQTGLDLYDKPVNDAYLQFGQNPTNGNAMAVYDASLQSLGDAVAQQQAGTLALTQPQMDAINAQANAVQARANELAVQVSGTQAGTLAQQTLAQAEQLVTALQALPPGIKTKIGYDGVFNAFLSAMMNGG